MELKKVMGWLSGFPGFAGYQWEVDCLPHKPDTVTLTPKGITVERTVENVLGGRKEELLFTCTVAFSGVKKTQVLLDLYKWVLLSTPPQLGEGHCWATVRDGRFLQKNKLGLDIYTAQLTVYFERFYEVNENGKN